uniref:Uncharacterized protein n=1 Tax=Anguilla anguilla TaxID=7936 RepID=A0A0E9XVU1_ANGAN
MPNIQGIILNMGAVCSNIINVHV